MSIVYLPVLCYVMICHKSMHRNCNNNNIKNNHYHPRVQSYVQAWGFNFGESMRCCDSSHCRFFWKKLCNFIQFRWHSYELENVSIL